jgi:hypothetical protein
MYHYKWRRNLTYMAMAFCRPRAVIIALLNEASPLYSVIPFVGYLIVGMLGTSAAILQGLSPDDSANPFPLLIPFASSDYYRFKLVFYPLLNLVALGLFAAIAWLLSRLSAFRKVSARQATLFLMFLSTIGIVAIMIESLPLPPIISSILIPLIGVIAVAYLTEFVHRQAALAHRKALVFSLISLTCYYTFRGVTMR